MAADRVVTNRAPVLTLWAAVVAERLGFDRDEALSVGKALAGLNAQTKGRNLGIFGPPKSRDARGAAVTSGLGEEMWVPLCGRSVPARRTPAGVRAVKGSDAIEAPPVETYLRKAFGERYGAVRAAMELLAAGMPADVLAEAAYGLYERFRPSVPAGKAGWGAKGELDLDLIRSLGAHEGGDPKRT